MGMMARMRSLAPWFILLVGGLFVLFMVVSDSKVMDIFGVGRSQNVGSVDGVDISYQEYSTLVERARKNQEDATKQTMDESQMDNFRDQIWQTLVTQKLLEKKIKEFGITVSDDEIRNAILGPNPPDFLKRQFIDSTGTFNRELYERTVMDPKNRDIMVGVEDQIREQLIQEKLQHFLDASITVSDEEVKDHFIAQNIKMKADYILVDPYTIAGEFKATDQQLKDYYEKHKDDYQVQPSRKIKYVLFRRAATPGDSAAIRKNLAAVVKKMEVDTASFKSYVDIYSEKPYSKDTLSINQLSGEAKNVIPEAKAGSIIGPILTSEGYVVYKLDDKIQSKDEFVRASHILVRKTGNDAADEKKANDIYNELMNGADFATLAKEKSDDGSKVNGGDLGWFGRGQMVPEFENACYGGKVGVIQKPIKTSFGWHIIKVTGKSNSKFVVERIINKIQPSGSTIDKLYQDAQDFSYITKENGFDSEAKVLRYKPVETPAFTKDNQFVPGLGMSPAIIQWAFDNGTGDISDVFKIASGYVVFMVSDVIKAGFKPFEDVKEQVRSAVEREMKFDKAVSIATEIKSKLGENGNSSIAKSVYPDAKTDTTAEFTTSGTIPALGREYAFTETAYKADLNKWTGPVKGSRGVYLIKVTYKTKYQPSTFAVQKSVLRSQLLQQRKNSYLTQWLQEIKKEADIVDNRYLFYR